LEDFSGLNWWVHQGTVGGHSFDLLEDSFIGFANVVSSLGVNLFCRKSLISWNLCETLEVEASFSLIIMEAISLIERIQSFSHFTFIGRSTFILHNHEVSAQIIISGVRFYTPKSFKLWFLFHITNHKLVLRLEHLILEAPSHRCILDTSWPIKTRSLCFVWGIFSSSHRTTLVSPLNVF